MTSRYPNITPLPQSALFKIEPDCYSDMLCTNLDYSGNNDLMLSSVFSSEMYSPYVNFEPDMYNLPNFTVPSNASPYSPQQYVNEHQYAICSPGLNMRNSSPNQFELNHFESINSPQNYVPEPNYINMSNPDPFLNMTNPEPSFLNMTNPEPHPSLITAKPTPRALKAKRCPTNKCNCGGKKSCQNPLCAKSVGCFSCPVCGIEFSRKNSMRRHVLTHINLRPYECQDCNKSFYRSDIYKRHLLSKRCKRNLTQTTKPHIHPSRP